LPEARIEPRVVARRLAARRGGARRGCRSALDEPCGRPGSGERPRARRLRARPLVRRVAVEDLSMKVGLLMEAAETQQALAAAAPREGCVCTSTAARRPTAKPRTTWWSRVTEPGEDGLDDE